MPGPFSEGSGSALDFRTFPSRLRLTPYHEGGYAANFICSKRSSLRSRWPLRPALSPATLQPPRQPHQRRCFQRKQARRLPTNIRGTDRNPPRPTSIRPNPASRKRSCEHDDRGNGDADPDADRRARHGCLGGQRQVDGGAADSSVNDALRETPSLQVFQTGSPGTSSDISIRGATAAQTLMMIDGVAVNNSTTSEFDTSRLTTDDLNRVEVVRGSGGALYGSQAIGGVVNLITQEGSARRTSACCPWAGIARRKIRRSRSAARKANSLLRVGVILLDDRLSHHQ